MQVTGKKSPKGNVKLMNNNQDEELKNFQTVANG